MIMDNIAILCSGGDVSGMNAALKRFVEYSKAKGLTPYFVNKGYEGLIDNEIYKADYVDVAGIISRGGTKIHSSRSARFMEKKYRQIAIDNLISLGIGYLIILGGDGSFKGREHTLFRQDQTSHSQRRTQMESSKVFHSAACRKCHQTRLYDTSK